MNTIEKQANILARFIRSGNNKLISGAIEQLAKVDFSVAVVDKANLPFLVEVYSPNNQSAKDFLAQHRVNKDQQMVDEKMKILEELQEGALLMYEGMTIPSNMLTMFSIMTFTTDLDYIRTGFNLLKKLEFDLEEAGDAYDKARELRHQLPEAEALVQKIEGIVRQFEVVDDDMEGLEDDGDEADESMGDLDVSGVSDDSGMESDDDEEGGMNAQEQQKFEKARGEVMMTILANILRSKNEEMVSIAIDMLQGIQIPLELYQKYEITCLIYQFGDESDDVMDLWRKIDEEQESSSEMAKFQTFKEITGKIDRSKAATNGTMDLLMTYLEEDEKPFYIEEVTKMLLTMPLTLEQCQKYELKKKIMEIPKKTENVMKLIMKVKGLEDIAQIK